jgi:phosphatidylserine synthase
VNRGSPRARPAGAWRPGSVPEQLGVAGLGAAGAAVAYQAALGGDGIWLSCPLRSFTGIPCPLCGMTTAATGLASGDLGAVAANPFVLLLAGFTLVMAVLMAARALGWAPGAAQWPASRRRQSYWLVAAVAGASWAFQLHRFGWV